MVSNEVDPALLPPSQGATYFHSLRVHLEMMRAQKLDIDCGLDPHEWGWQRVNGQLVPIMTDKSIAPQALFKIKRCNCKITT